MTEIFEINEEGRSFLKENNIDENDFLLCKYIAGNIIKFGDTKMFENEYNKAIGNGVFKALNGREFKLGLDFENAKAFIDNYAEILDYLVNNHLEDLEDYEKLCRENLVEYRVDVVYPNWNDAPIVRLAIRVNNLVSFGVKTTDEILNENTYIEITKDKNDEISGINFCFALQNEKIKKPFYSEYLESSSTEGLKVRDLLNLDLSLYLYIIKDFKSEENGLAETTLFTSERVAIARKYINL